MESNQQLVISNEDQTLIETLRSNIESANQDYESFGDYDLYTIIKTSKGNLKKAQEIIENYMNLKISLVQTPKRFNFNEHSHIYKDMITFYRSNKKGSQSISVKIKYYDPEGATTEEKWK